MAKKIKPEKEVEQKIKAWLSQNGFEFAVYDSKGTYSQSAGRYTKSQSMKSGTPDLLGISPLGHFVAIELKAPGKEDACRLAQYQFLERYIQKNGFCLVTSSVEFLETSYSNWLKLKLDKRDKEAVGLLLSLLPKKVIVGTKVLSL